MASWWVSADEFRTAVDGIQTRLRRIESALMGLTQAIQNLGKAIDVSKELSPEDQAKINEIYERSKATKAKMDAAIPKGGA